MPQAPDFSPDTSFAARIVPSPNFGQRAGGLGPSILLLHYTGMTSAEAAIKWLAAPQSQVSCHYVVDERGAVTQMVPEACRAWHAGQSSWLGVTDINSSSIGIEIQNPGHDGGYPEFPENQMDAVEALCLDIVRRHGIEARHVLAHSDVAPNRKIDPGEKFDWGRLAQKGIGLWVQSAPILSGGDVLALGHRGEAVLELQRKLAAYGYGLQISGEYGEQTQSVVKAFQRHFRPALIDGRADGSTAATLDALLAALPAA